MPGGSTYLLVNKYWGSSYFPVNNYSGVLFLRAVFINGYTGFGFGRLAFFQDLKRTLWIFHHAHTIHICSLFLYRHK